MTATYAPMTKMDALTAQLDLLAETRTEDRHPVPELVVWLAECGYTVVGMTTLQFADEAFDLWERIRANESTISRFDPEADPGTRPERTYAAIEAITEQAHSDLSILVAAHLHHDHL